MTDMKKCTSCGEVRPIEEFHKRASTISRQSECRICINVKAKAKRDSRRIERAKRAPTSRKASAKEEAALFNSMNARW